jgi:predicted RNase H-like HicB family nuclease
MKYPIAIEPGNATTAWGVVVPDLPGCFSAADSGIDEAITNAQEAIELWMETALDLGQTIPAPSAISVGAVCLILDELIRIRRSQ